MPKKLYVVREISPELDNTFSTFPRLTVNTSGIFKSIMSHVYRIYLKQIRNKRKKQGLLNSLKKFATHPRSKHLFDDFGFARVFFCLRAVMLLLQIIIIVKLVSRQECGKIQSKIQK